MNIERQGRRLSDDDLRLLADSQPLGPSWTRDVLLELLEHRARIAARAEAHAKRLSDEAIARFRADAEVGISGFGHGAEPSNEDTLAMTREIQERRAADLTADEISALEIAVNPRLSSEQTSAVWRAIAKVKNARSAG